MFDVANDGDEGLRINELFKGFVVKLQLAGDGDHHSVKPFFHNRPISSDAQLGTEHHVEGVGFGTADFIAELQAGYFPFLASCFLIGVTHQAGEHSPEIDMRNGNVTVVVPRNSLQIL